MSKAPESSSSEMLDLLIVGSGPTGLAIGVAAQDSGLQTLIVDRGALCNAILHFPHHMNFFTTRDKLEIADLPFTIADDKPDRRQALVYYQGVVRRHHLPLALHEDVIQAQRIEPEEGEPHFLVTTEKDGRRRERRARRVALATGYFDQPQKLSVPGEESRWVHTRYLEPYPHFNEHVVLIGGGNTACEAALDLWRNQVRVTVVHRRRELKKTVKYWVKPDVENRIEEGSIGACFESVVREFREAEPGVHEVVLDTPAGERVLRCDHAYVLIGYTPDANLERRCGIEIDPETLVPTFDPATCETNVPGLYVTGTLQSGRDTGKIFIENSRDHGRRIVDHILAV